jgi:hypothetical protein
MVMKKIILFFLNNYFLTAIGLMVLFVGSIACYRLFFTRPLFAYVKVKVNLNPSYGSIIRPGYWIVDALKNNSEEKNLFGQTIATILSVRSYPYYYSDQYDVYISAKLRVTGNPKTGRLTYKRTSLGVGTPIELELPGLIVNGTVLSFSQVFHNDTRIEKTLVLIKRNAFPWEYDAINVGDSYNDGVEDVFKILGKTATNSPTISVDSLGFVTPGSIEQRQYIALKASVKVTALDGQLFYGEDQVVRKGQRINLATNSLTLTDYFVSDIQ